MFNFCVKKKNFRKIFYEINILRLKVILKKWKKWKIKKVILFNNNDFIFVYVF